MAKTQGKIAKEKAAPKVEKHIPPPAENVHEVEHTKLENKYAPDAMEKRIHKLESEIESLQQLNAALDEKIKKVAAVAGVAL